MLKLLFLKEDAIEILISIALPYIVFAGAAFCCFYLWKNTRFWYNKIQQFYPKKKHIAREISLSAVTIIIFSAVILAVKWAGYHGYTRIYAQISDRGYIYYVLSIMMMLVIQDTYFYWMHRLLHWKPIFKYVHKVHHLSTNPTPFAAYAFHPVEAVIQVGIVPVIAFTVPYHISAIITFSISSLLLNTLVSHMGFEFFPKGFTSHRYFKWLNPSTHHNMHHSLTKCNYGLYLNIWDKVMRTNHRYYEQRYNRIVTARETAKLAKSLQTDAIECYD